MALRTLLRPFIICFLLTAFNGLHAQSTLQRLYAFNRHHRPGNLLDTAYLKQVDSIAPQLLDDDSLPERLIPYQHIAFGGDVPAKFRMHYFTYMALQAVNKNRYGSAIYYSEKNNDEAVKAGIFEKNALPHSELFAVSVYCMNKDYKRAFVKYLSLRPVILGMAKDIPSGKVSPESAFVAISILEEIANAGYQTGDTAKSVEARDICKRMLVSITGQPGKYRDYKVFYDCKLHTMEYYRDRDKAYIDSARDFLETAIGEARSSGFLPSLRPYNTFDLYNDAFDFFFKQGQIDSAQHYLDLVRALPAGLLDHMKLIFLLDGGSQVEAKRGDYTSAYRDLRQVFQVEDSSLTAVSSDKDNNLYALAEAEDTRAALIMTRDKKRQVEQFNIFLFCLLAVLVVMVLSGYFIIRSRQKHRLLQLRLSLARNFHDEVGPMLLYANTLVKKDMEANPSPRMEELKGHLVNVMEAVRGITHDLRSSELSTIRSFGKEVTHLLDKIKATTGIDATVLYNNGHRVLSHFQYTHLKKIVNELISNSIRHGACRHIDIHLKVTERYLNILYLDDGKGFAPGQPEGGIGLKNIRERTHLLNGTFLINNAYPDGYSIDIEIPLL